LPRATPQIFLSGFSIRGARLVESCPIIARTGCCQQTQAATNHSPELFQCQAHLKTASATAAAGVLIWPKPPSIAVNVVLLLRLHIDSGGVSARLLLCFGFGEAKAKRFVSPDTKKACCFCHPQAAGDKWLIMPAADENQCRSYTMICFWICYNRNHESRRKKHGKVLRISSHPARQVCSKKAGGALCKVCNTLIESRERI
jgi:hypothetical protein